MGYSVSIMKKLLLALTGSLYLFAQEKVDQINDAKMRSEELEHTQILHTLHMLTDRYGPRVTGTPNHEQAAKWAVTQMTQWGLQNAHLEPWEFGHPGWLNETADGHIVSPVKQNLKFEVLAWTPSTRGSLTASVIQLEPPVGPMPAAAPDAANAGGRGGGRGGPQRLGPLKEDMQKWIEANKGRVRGKIVLIGKAAVVPVNFDAPVKRQPDDVVKRQFDPANPNGGRGGRGGFTPPAEDPTRYTAVQVTEQIDNMLVANGALMRVNDAARAEGIIVAQQHRGYDPATAVPTVILRNDDFGRVERLLDDGDDVKLQFDIRNHIYPEGKTSYNVIAEIPGTDKADEIVMLGGHLDSWHSATGATDNAIGCSIMMEAARLIQSAGIKPRRTIRVALWSGEEEGLLGITRIRETAFRNGRRPQARVVPAGRLLQCGYRYGQDSRRGSFWARRSGRCSPARPVAI